MPVRQGPPGILKAAREDDSAGVAQQSGCHGKARSGHHEDIGSDHAMEGEHQGAVSILAIVDARYIIFPFRGTVL